MFFKARDPNALFMINYRVDDLHALVGALRDEGCQVLDKIDESEYGKFGWVVDPEGNKIELWSASMRWSPRRCPASSAR